MRYLLLFVILLTGCAPHVPFSKTDCALIGASSLAIAADWSQTIKMQSEPDKFFEHNIFLDAHPGRAKINRYFIGCLAANYGLSYYLKPTPRKVWLGSILVFEVGVVGANFKSGIRLSW